jgi:spore germination cell wall hydrolase CwlJ-like protein
MFKVTWFILGTMWLLIVALLVVGFVGLFQTAQSVRLVRSYENESNELRLRFSNNERLIAAEMGESDAILTLLKTEQDERDQKHKIVQLSPVQCLTDNIYYEAGFEPYEGQLAVAQVTLNRAHENPRDVCQVVYFKKVNPSTHKKEAAFSWTLGKKWRPKGINRKAYGECKQLAQAVLTKGLRSAIIDDGVEFYAAVYIHPRWANEHEKVTTIGQHVFYR